jgi:2-C-methyl-D-erythritol 4-phosphate cytidylyltransferase
VTSARPPIEGDATFVDDVTPAPSSARSVGDVVQVVWTVVVAGGSGARFGRPKQYELLDDRRVLDHSVGVAAGVSDGVVVVVPAADVAVETPTEPPTAPPTAPPASRVVVVAGGATRSESVRAGLAAVPAGATVVCVHDAARPFASAALYGRVVAAVSAGADAAVPALAVTDTIKIVDRDAVVVATPERASLRAVQTPQAFRADVLRRAHASAGEGTDDASLVEAIGGRVVIVDGETDNRKITHPDDLDWARRRAALVGSGAAPRGSAGA